MCPLTVLPVLHVLTLLCSLSQGTSSTLPTTGKEVTLAVWLHLLPSWWESLSLSNQAVDTVDPFFYIMKKNTSVVEFFLLKKK